jgi:hypothetical protein
MIQANCSIDHGSRQTETSSIDLTDAAEAEETFTGSWGRSRTSPQFIEDNALNVRNLDI